MNDRLQELQVFVRVAESGNLSRAGRELGLAQPSVSRIVSQLETRLGVVLLLRTTRQVTLTDAGETYLARARQILADLDEADHAARGVDSLQGLVRLATPVLYGTLRIVPHLPALMALHPGLRINLSVADHYQDLIAEGADVAIRIGKLADSAMGARKLETLERFAVAAPAYLAQHGVPATPAELAGHECIFGPGAFGTDTWEFRDAAATHTVNVQGRVQTHSGAAVMASAIAGVGIALSTNVAAADALREGKLVRLLEEYQMPPVDVHAVYPQGPRPSQKVRAVVEFLAEHIKIT